MKAVNVYRNGECKLRVPAEIRNGVLRSGANILINGDLIKTPWTRESVVAEINAGRITPEIEAMGLHIGDNGNGVVCRWAADERAEREAAMTPAQRERRDIAAMYAKADRIANSDSEDNVWLPMQIRGEAKERMAEWRAKYPAEAAQERAGDLRAQADHKREMAVGALVYDADGSLSHTTQQARHDALIREAQALEAEAARLAEAE